MKWKKTVYTSHRWLALLVSLQLLAWSVGGFVFSVLDIDNVHGDLERRMESASPIDVSGILLTPAEALEHATNAGVPAADVARISMRTRSGRNTAYEIYDNADVPLAVVDAATGDVVRRISEEAAGESALCDFAPEADVLSIQLLEDEPPLEYRGKPMPVYRVILDHPKKPHIYVSPVTGEVITRRNRPWRIFDFFWMLHIMDYGERESFDHLLLTFMSLLAIATSASGLVLWSFRVRFRRRPKRGDQVSSVAAARDS